MILQCNLIRKYIQVNPTAVEYTYA
uniref:Uncharacterized protein n=1 Tax=Anguilla anguilla TaxID=7936 RepID=A0A0E9V6Y8_ANGAN